VPSINEQKFLEFYDQYVEKIYRYIFFRIGSQELAEDLTSEVFLRSWQYVNQNLESESSFKAMQNPRAFFYQVARNLLVDFHRQKGKSPISLDEITDIKIADKKDDPIEITSRSMEMETVRKALVNLNDDYQEIIIWRYLEELEIKEIAEILNKSEGAIRVLICRAINNLKGALDRGEAEKV
jgi:RNA polymerase sigma-70 factor (ECF subfamily)